MFNEPRHCEEGRSPDVAIPWIEERTISPVQKNNGIATGLRPSQ